MDWRSKAKEVFKLQKTYDNVTVNNIILKCANAYKGVPEWREEVDTVNFTKTICEETARLIMLGTSVKFNESARGKYLQKVIDKQYFNLRQWAEYAMAYGTVIIKPNGEDFDCVLPDNYFVTDVKNGEIWGAVFVTVRNIEKDWYTRLEYHRFEKDVYKISNRAFLGKSSTSIDREINMKNSPWKELTRECEFENIESPLFAVLRTPQGNNIDPESPFGLPLVAQALWEMKFLDIAFFRMTHEIDQSKRTVLLDSDRLLTGSMTKEQRAQQIATYNDVRKSMGLPDYVRAVEGMGEGNFYSEINPTLNTEQRLKGINHLLSQIGYKIGFANGYFVFNEASGIQTATGVESNDQRTMQFIKDCRDRMEDALKELVAGISVFADTYKLAPAGTYEVTYQFGDITYNEDEDRARWLTYVNMGKMPFWRYLVKFEGFTEDEAKEIDAEMKVQDLLLPPEE